MTQIAEFQPNEIVATANEMDPMANPGGVDIWGIIARRKWLLILGMILGLGLGYIYLLQADPVYQSTARILVETKKPVTPFMADIGGYDYRSADSKHAIIITSPTIIMGAYENGGLEKLPTFAKAENPIRSLAENLLVEPADDSTDVVDVSFSGGNPEDTRKVVEAVITEYEKFLQETYKDTSEETRKLFFEARNELSKELENLEEKYQEFKKTAPTFYRQGTETVSLPEKHQQIFDTKRMELQQRLTEIEAEIVSVSDAIERKENLEPILLSAGERGNLMLRAEEIRHQEMLRNRFLPLLMELEHLSSKFGPDHPDVKTVQRQIDKFKSLFPNVQRETGFERSPEEIAEIAQNYLASLHQTKIKVQAELASVSKQFDAEEEATRALAIYKDRDQFFQDEIGRTKDLFQSVVTNLTQLGIATNENYDGYRYSKLGPPGDGEKIAPMPLKIIPVSAILGLAAGFGIAYLVDLSDKAFRTPDEVSRVMRLPVVGHIPLIDVAKTKILPGSEISPVMITVHRPKSPQSESYRAIRTALYFNNRDEQHQVIQVTSPMPGDGKSTLAANLAVTIAQSGKSVLIMDADFRRPTLHKVFGLDKPATGLASIVKGDTEPQDAIIEIRETPNLHVLACGPRPENPSELLSSQQFADTLEMFREQYDFVIVDTPPVLAVSDPCAVSARVDGVILTFRIHKRARPLAVRARDALGNSGAKVIGLVVNGVDQEAGGYYSQYRYGYSGYRYAYNYRYGYGYGQYGAYGSEAAESKAISQYFDDDGQVTETAKATLIDDE